MNRQTVTYKDLSRMMFGKEAAGVLAQILGHVAFFCIDNRLPPLTSIVVGKGGGTPGHGIPINPASIDEERENVFGYDWYDVYPPSEDEFATAYAQHMANA